MVIITVVQGRMGEIGDRKEEKLRNKERKRRERKREKKGEQVRIYERQLQALLPPPHPC